MVIVPSLVSLIINLIIFKSVRQSSHRVQAQSQITNGEDAPTISRAKTISRRDLHLLRHILVMFCIFIGGWSPVSIYAVVVPLASWTSLELSLLILLAECSVIADVINLFIYNHEVRGRLKTRIFKCQ